jgi:hypothetical protein
VARSPGGFSVLAQQGRGWEIGEEADAGIFDIQAT